jgi:hypothetical protein
MNELERVCYEHEIRAKLNCGFKLSQRQESYYLIYMAGHEERYQYIKNKRREKDATARANSKSANI